MSCDRLEGPLPRALGVTRPLERPDGVAGLDRVAVGEPGVLAQEERPGLAVGRGGPLLGQVGLEAVALDVDPDELLVDLHEGPDVGVRVLGHGVEVLGRPVDAEADDLAGLLGRGLGSHGPETHQHQPGGQHEREDQSSDSHRSYLLVRRVPVIRHAGGRPFTTRGRERSPGPSRTQGARSRPAVGRSTPSPGNPAGAGRRPGDIRPPAAGVERGEMTGIPPLPRPADRCRLWTDPWPR